MKKSLIPFLVFILILFFGCGTPKESVKRIGSEGTLQIICKPSSAEVFVDGASMGEVGRYDGHPGYIKLDRGTHTIEIRKKGYAPFMREVYASQYLQTIEVSLEKLK